MKRVLVIAILFISFSVHADCKLSWDANPPDENVTGYIADIDGNQVTTAADDTDVLCSEFTPAVDESKGRHTATVYAVNEFGKSGPSNSVPFGPPSEPANVSVKKE